jgi:hypothetical protein
MLRPLDELIALTADEQAAARRLCCSPEFVLSWRPRRHWQTGQLEPGIEPSAGFIAAALALLRSSPIAPRL